MPGVLFALVAVVGALGIPALARSARRRSAGTSNAPASVAPQASAAGAAVHNDMARAPTRRVSPPPRTGGVSGEVAFGRVHTVGSPETGYRRTVTPIAAHGCGPNPSPACLAAQQNATNVAAHLFGGVPGVGPLIAYAAKAGLRHDQVIAKRNAAAAAAEHAATVQRESRPYSPRSVTADRVAQALAGRRISL